VTFYTAGHSNVGIDEFLQLLKEHGVNLLVDLRSRPASRFAQFNQRPLQASLGRAGIQYAYMGNRLGGMPRDQAVLQHWRKGKLVPEVISYLRSTGEWQDGLRDLAEAFRGEGVAGCIMCGEGDPSRCHRTAVAEDLQQLTGWDFEHLRVHSPAKPRSQQGSLL
jgi:uncharacterized protein (DUF488 family)